MYGKFVGLDIGSKDIKISLIKRGLRDVQLLQTIRTEISSSPEGDSDSLSEVFKAYSLPKGDIAASIVQSPTSIRVVNFPFSDPKKIDQVYEYELENLATFDPRAKIHGYHLVKNGAGSEALVCVFEKNHVSELIGSFNEHGIDPKIITYTPLAFSALNEFLSSERPLLLIDLGDSEISYILFDENGIRRVRSSTKSVEMFLNKLNQIGEMDYYQDFSQLVIGNQDGSNLEECFAPILSEIKKTVQFFELEVKVKIKTIEISGSLSLIRGMGDFLKDTLNKDVKKIYIPDLGADKSSLYAKSYALALYGSSFKNGYLNFRKDEFKYSGVDNEFRKVLMVPGILLGILILFLIYTSASSYYELKNNVDNIEAQIAQVVKDTFPEVKVIPKPILYMQSEVGKVREKLDLIEGVQGGQTPLDALRDISSSLPESLQLTVNDIKFESADKIKIQGVCGSYQEVAEIEEALEKSGMFETVTRDQTGNAQDGKTKFEISVVLKSKA
ncbi:MAG: hypothetical protein E4H21_04685 [Thermodesulfobacteriales bacterium]|nr:MAG: hypothetical protein E4H21_04685 [Thermodesulfobacteriales bacterium]